MKKRILVLRHAPAEIAAVRRRMGRSDADRCLTTQGRRDMLAAARGLRGLVSDIDLIVASPLLRAEMTAALIARAYPHAARMSLDLLAPGSNPVQLTKWIGRRNTPAVTAMVGHEPNLSLWIGHMLIGKPQSIVSMKKGSACCLEVMSQHHRISGRLLWLLTIEQLGSL